MASTASGSTPGRASKGFDCPGPCQAIAYLREGVSWNSCPSPWTLFSPLFTWEADVSQSSPSRPSSPNRARTLTVVDAAPSAIEADGSGSGCQAAASADEPSGSSHVEPPTTLTRLNRLGGSAGTLRQDGVVDGQAGEASQYFIGSPRHACSTASELDTKSTTTWYDSREREESRLCSKDVQKDAAASRSTVPETDHPHPVSGGPSQAVPSSANHSSSAVDAAAEAGLLFPVSGVTTEFGEPGAASLQPEVSLDHMALEESASAVHAAAEAGILQPVTEECSSAVHAAAEAGLLLPINGAAQLEQPEASCVVEPIAIEVPALERGTSAAYAATEAGLHFPVPTEAEVSAAVAEAARSRRQLDVTASAFAQQGRATPAVA